MSTASEREAALRRALQSAAEYIEPAPGGLERIHERLRRPRPMLVAQLEAAGTVVLMRAPDVIEAVRRRAANVLRLVYDRFGPKQAAGKGPLRWLRPLAAMCVAVFVIGAGVYVGLASPTPLFPTGGVSLGAAGDAGTHPGGRAASGVGTPLGSGSPPSYPTALSSSGRTSACPTSTPRFRAPTSSPASTSTSPTATTTSPSTGTSSSSPPDSTTPTPGSSTPSAGAGAASNAAVTSGNPASAVGSNGTGASDTGVNGSPARRSAANTNASQTAPPSHAPIGKGKPTSSSPKLPCHSPKPKSTPAKKSSSPSTATQTSAKLGHTQPGKAVAATLD